MKVYHKKNCVQCRMTMKELDRNGVAYEAISLEEHPEVISELKQKGFGSAPVVSFNDQMWAGFQPDKIKVAVAELKGL